jgi:Zn-dependent M28 family amino/carboxypeptidase
MPPSEISADTLREVTRLLASDFMEGRAPGTVGESRTLAYVVGRFAAAGLMPGNRGSWFQEVPLVETTGSGHTALRIAGASQPPLDFAYGRDFVAVTNRTVPRVDLAGSDMVFVGYGIVAPERGWNDYAGVDMRGKTAIILVNDPDYASPGLQGPFGGRAMSYYGRWTYKFEEAAKHGAAAALIIHDAAPAAYGWNVVESSWSGPQSQAASAAAEPQTLVNGWVQKPAAERILAAAGRDLASLTAAAQRPGFRPVPLGLKASLSFANSVRHYYSYNVVGTLPGRERPGEAVLYSAHWDHLGRCKPDATGDDICNGAIDNATGVAALVGLAEAHRKAGPAQRSLLFLALTAEESGLLGSEYYAANPVVPLDRTAGGVNLDALSLAGRSRDVTVVGSGKSELDSYLSSALGAQGRVATPDPYPEKGFYYRSDHFSFAKRGVPMLFIEGGEDLLSGGRAAGAAWHKDYADNRYHGPNDEFDPAWDWSGVVEDVLLAYRLGRMLAETTAWPNWVPGDEFRAIRDASCAAAAGGC